MYQALKRLPRRLLLIHLLLLSSLAQGSAFETDIVAAAKVRTTKTVTYDGRYLAIAYPGGDVPSTIGVCTDVIIRTYRALGTDLQKLVHEDIRDNFSAYPSNRIWGLTKPDKNIDHRRVPNLQAFFSRHGKELAISRTPEAYQSGNIVTWMLPGNLPHIGIVTDKINTQTGNPMIVHNIGRGPELEDMLFEYKITGHYRYIPTKYQ